MVLVVVVIFVVIVVVVVVIGCIPDGQVRSRYCYANDQCCTGVCAYNGDCGKDSAELGFTHHTPLWP